MDEKILAEYQSLMFEIKNIEKKLQNTIQFMFKSETNDQFRCRDYSERGIHIFIPFDEINPNYFKDEKLENFINDLKLYFISRNKQKKLEVQIDIMRNMKNQLEGSINGLL